MAARSVFVLGALAGAVVLSSAASEPLHVARRCSIGWSLRTRDTATTYVLAQGTPDTVFAGAGAITVDPPLEYVSSRRVFGQVMRAEDVRGAGSEIIRRALTARRSSEIVVVPWDYSASCAPWYWEASARWAAPDSRGVFFLTLRPESTWVGGRPTLDARYASIATYADGPRVAGPHAVIRFLDDTLAVQPNLSAREYFGLLMALPAAAEVQDSTARARLREWVHANPGVRRRYPGSIILANWPEQALK